MSEKKNSGLQDFFKGLKTEYNKIIFPTRQDIIKETPQPSLSVSWSERLLLFLILL